MAVFSLFHRDINNRLWYQQLTNKLMHDVGLFGFVTINDSEYQYAPLIHDIAAQSASVALLFAFKIKANSLRNSHHICYGISLLFYFMVCRI